MADTINYQNQPISSTQIDTTIDPINPSFNLTTSVAVVNYVTTSINEAIFAAMEAEY